MKIDTSSGMSAFNHCVQIVDDITGNDTLTVQEMVAWLRANNWPNLAERLTGLATQVGYDLDSHLQVDQVEQVAR